MSSSYRLIYKKPAAKEIQKIPAQIRKRLKVKLEWWINQADPLHFADHLTDPRDAQYRYRIGVYRVLFDVKDKDIVILHIQHRKDVYRR
jgi:mRNA interferase RelE/StbE